MMYIPTWQAVTQKFVFHEMILYVLLNLKVHLLGIVLEM